MFFLLHQIAFAASETGHTELLGVIYDELVREHWQSMSLKTRNFHLASEISEINKCYLDKAKALHDKLLGAPKVAHLLSFTHLRACAFACGLPAAAWREAPVEQGELGHRQAWQRMGEQTLQRQFMGKQQAFREQRRWQEML